MNRWGEYRYKSLDYYVKSKFDSKLYKIALDGGFTCPNRDGKVSTGGCVFCSEDGSGDFATPRHLPINRQLSVGKSLISHKVKVPRYIAYFQAFTNTYGPIEHLRKIFTEAILDPEVVILSIATRPDCLNDDVLRLLNELNQIKPIWVELGLQTSNYESAQHINRCYGLSTFEEAVFNLRKIGIEVIVHTIIGLPKEAPDGILDTIAYINTQDVQGIKLQLLHVLKDTKLAMEYLENPFWIPTMDEYINLLGHCISNLRPDIVVHRITGDGPKDLLIAPLWSGNKKYVLNSVRKHFKEADIWQGKSLK